MYIDYFTYFSELERVSENGFTSDQCKNSELEVENSVMYMYIYNFSC